MLMGAIIVTGCEDEMLVNDVLAPESLTAAMTSESGLRISRLVEDGEDKTAVFSDYLFVFAENGGVVAAHDGDSVSGTYSVFSDDGRTELRMTFLNSTKFLELNDDWYFVSETSTSIQFEDAGDVIHFAKQ